ncbi:DNA polymerase III subunit gamma/tau [Anaerohalosphaera lusitana]|uniref:DNA polymerase III subunit delta' n=1 Tax=Anaerohalosphaera lusitana TaxID=1936003 RepID=A0A1U9NHZ4_9BACT|nr:DNA polymerase III subunit delta' C-terminal domain-containing protein [Anaerohalosphaera lusitana]AQT67562.1 DNA polymerase III subunit gamma/tau [Anaerohalosphaera lusitana]
MSLKDIFCQDKPISTLQNAYAAGRLAHGYIFAGPDGVGRYKTAREWAKVLLCQEPVSGQTEDGKFYDSCGVCESCKLFEGDGHPDFHHVYKELVRFTEKGKNKKTPVQMPIDVIREFLIEKVAAKPKVSESTVYVLSESEKLNAESQNALLKVLEEPPGHCSIILLCSRLEKLLPTTLSRCQVLRFGDIDEQKIVERLAANGVEQTEATFWARFSDGSIGNAMEWAALELKNDSCYKIKQILVKGLARHQLSRSLDFAEWLSNSSKSISAAWADVDENTSKTDLNRRAQKGLIRMMIAFFKDVMRMQAGLEDNLVNSDQMQEVKTMASRIDPDQAAKNIEKACENMIWVEKNVNERLIFEDLLLNYAGCGRM